MATRVWESTVIDAPVATVWDLLRPLSFSYLPTVAHSAIEGSLSAAEVGSVHVVTYKDKTIQKLRLTELSDSKYSISWDLVESVPAHHTSAASYTVRLRSVTAGNLTFVEWVVDFSKDVTNEAMVDAGYKARENFKALAATAKAKLLEQAASTPVGKAKVTVPELRRQLSARSSELHKLFSSLDKNGNGVLEFDEFALAVNKLYGENLADEAIRMLLRMADTNNDNVVSYEEFVKFLEAEGLEAKALGKASTSKEDVKSAVVLPGDVTLHYFNARGRAEIPRLIMAEAGIKYTDNRMDFKDFQEKLKSKLPFGQMPALTVGKTTIAQSQAINRYLAKAGGLYGKTTEDQAKIDMLTDTWYGDIGQVFSNAWYNKDPAQKEAGLAKFWAETFPTYTSLMEKMLANIHTQSKQPTQWFINNTFSLADIVCYDQGTRYLTVNKDCLNACPLLHQLITRVSVRPKIAHWIKTRPVTQS